MKFAKLLTVILIAVFAVSIQLEAGFKKDLKKALKNADKKENEKKETTAKAGKLDSKYDYVITENSDLESDVIKLLPAKSAITHMITEGVFGPADGTKGSILIIPYITGNNGKVQLMLLVPAEPQKYNKMMLGEIKFGANTAQEVHSVFFDQADKDKERELFVLCSYEKGGETILETAVYNLNNKKFVRVPALESKIANQYPAINIRRTLRALESQTEVKKIKK